MSLDKQTTMKLNLLARGESRRGWIRLGNGASISGGRASESKNNKCYASSYRHGGVGGVRMLRSVIETSREILIDAKVNKATKATHIASPSDKNVMLHEEVGVANMSDDAPVMGCGAKEPYLVDVNREVGLTLTMSAHSRRCDGW